MSRIRKFGASAPPSLPTWSICVCFGLLALMARSGQALEGPSGNPVMVRGEVVETGCFVIGNRHGPDHRQCAIACARAGQDLGVLDEETGLLHIEILDQRGAPVESALLAHVADRVEVLGRRWERGGLGGIEIKRVRPLPPRPEAPTK